MREDIQKALDFVNQTLDKAEKYEHAARVLNYDQETICPEKGRLEQGEVGAMLSNQAFKLTKQPEFIEAAETLYEGRDELGEWDQALADQLHRSYERTKNVSPEKQHEWSLSYNEAFVKWLEAKQKKDYSVFEPSLEKVVGIAREQVSLLDNPLPDTYANLLADYERGVSSEELNEWFGAYKERMIPLLKKIMASPKKIRTDFLARPVKDYQQAEMARYLLEVIGYDFERGAFTTTEHPFTDGIGQNDVRITTKYKHDNFSSNMFTVIHEGGHALFEMLQPRENYAHHINGGKTMGMHESVSRFYENRIGRSKEFVHLIYPKVCEIFPDAMSDVSEQELYEALNVVQPSLIRTEADEFTYPLHIIIRIEIEQGMLDGSIPIDKADQVWADKYEEYLGVRPENPAEGILQDVHWTFGFAYFPTYGLGNMYNAMYYNRLKEEIDLPAAISSGDFKTIDGWMAEHVFKKADRMDMKSWIRDICGRDFTPNDFLDYLEEKYSALYEL